MVKLPPLAPSPVQFRLLSDHHRHWRWFPAVQNRPTATISFLSLSVNLFRCPSLHVSLFLSLSVEVDAHKSKRTSGPLFLGLSVGSGLSRRQTQQEGCHRPLLLPRSFSVSPVPLCLCLYGSRSLSLSLSRFYPSVSSFSLILDVPLSLLYFFRWRSAPKKGKQRPPLVSNLILTLVNVWLIFNLTPFNFYFI